MVETTTPPSQSSKKAIYWVASLALAGVLLYFSLRGIEWRQVWVAVGRARVPFVVLSLLLMTAALFLRSFRWRVILSAEGTVSISLAFWATAAGYLGNNVLPARAGEVVRSLMISSRTGMSKAYVLTTALSERVVDAIAVITISSVVLLTMKERPGLFATAARPLAIMGFCGVAAIVLVPAFEVFWFKFLGILPLPPKLRSQVEDALRHGLKGLRSFHDYGRVTRFILLTAVIWCTDAATTLVLSRGMDLQITIPMAFLLTAGLALGSALPSTPGYVGIYQFVAVSILVPFGLSRTDAIAYILLWQGLNYLMILAWGGIAFTQQRRPAAAAVVEN